MHIGQAHKKNPKLPMTFFKCLAMNLAELEWCKWVDIEIKGIDAFMKGVNTHIDARGGESLKLGGNASALLVVPRSKLQVFTH